MTRGRCIPRGLYALTDAELPAGHDLMASVRAWLAGGAVMVQYRDKTAEAARRRREAGALVELCRGAGAPLIVNDDVALAHEVGAHGVHLGEEDPGIEAARERLGPEALIGASCYDSLDRAREAVRRGADYVAFGSVYPSATKPAARRATLALIRQARAELDVAIAAIGGLTADNAGTVIDAGADLLAVIAGLRSADPEAAARAYAHLFASGGVTQRTGEPSS